MNSLVEWRIVMMVSVNLTIDIVGLGEGGLYGSYLRNGAGDCLVFREIFQSPRSGGGLRGELLYWEVVSGDVAIETSTIHCCRSHLQGMHLIAFGVPVPRRR